MEGKIPHVPAAHWKRREAGGMICSQNFGLRIRGAGDVNLIQDQKIRCDVLAQPAKQVKRGYLFPLSFVLVMPSVDWMMATHVGEGNLLSLLIQTLVNFNPKHPRDTHRY